MWGGGSSSQKKENIDSEDKDADEDAAARANTTVSDAKPKEIRTAIRGKMILFDGYYREKEIDLFFGVIKKSVDDKMIY